MTIKTRDKIGADEAIQLLRAQMVKFGENYVYPSGELDGCFNWRRTAGGPAVPSCIVGHVLFDLGEAGRIDWSEVDESLDIETVNYALGEPFTGDAVEVLSEAQSIQDAGFTWGVAVRDAEGVAAQLGYEVSA